MQSFVIGIIVLSHLLFPSLHHLSLGNRDDEVSARSMAVGAHVLIDDFWILESSNITRVVQQPSRHSQNPVITSQPDFKSAQPFVTVVKDPQLGKYRLWYNAFLSESEYSDTFWGPSLSYLESDDGVTWQKPMQRLDLEHSVSASIIDEGEDFEPKEERFKQVYSLMLRSELVEEGEDWIKTRIAFSADGINWDHYFPDASYDTLFPGHGLSGSENWGDIINTYYDPIRDRYGFFFRIYERYEWEDLAGVIHDETIRKTGSALSKDYKQWTVKGVLFEPDQGDEGITQFYGGPAGVHQRGDLLIGFLKVLRDDLIVEGAPEGAYGTGYTVLAWTRDGKTWVRDRHTDPFLLPASQIDAWDHAHAWIDSVVEKYDRLILYYGGYQWGHKYNRSEDRQIGLASMERDRYVARQAGSTIGRITTPLLQLQSDDIAINADTALGWIEVSFLDQNMNPVAQCARIEGVDALRQSLHCTPKLQDIFAQPMHMQFTMQDASLFAVNVEHLENEFYLPLLFRDVTEPY